LRLPCKAFQDTISQKGKNEGVDKKGADLENETNLEEGQVVVKGLREKRTKATKGGHVLVWDEKFFSQWWIQSDRIVEKTKR